MKTKIEIKSTNGNVLFVHKSKNNTIKKTLNEGIKKGVNFSNCDLSNCDLNNYNFDSFHFKGADFSNSNLSGSSFTFSLFSQCNFRNCDLCNCNISYSNFTNCDLGFSNLSFSIFRNSKLIYSNLIGSNLKGSKFRSSNDEIITVKKIMFVNGLYKYDMAVIIDENNTKWVKLGCYIRKLSDWKKDFWNNKEFLNDKSEKSELRILAFKTAKKLFKII